MAANPNDGKSTCYKYGCWKRINATTVSFAGTAPYGGIVGRKPWVATMNYKFKVYISGTVSQVRYVELFSGRSYTSAWFRAERTRLYSGCEWGCRLTPPQYRDTGIFGLRAAGAKLSGIGLNLNVYDNRYMYETTFNKVTWRDPLDLTGEWAFFAKTLKMYRGEDGGYTFVDLQLPAYGNGGTARDI